MTLNEKLFTQNTEQEVVVTFASFWNLVLQPKVENDAAIRRAQRKDMTLKSTKVKKHRLDIGYRIE